MNKFLKNLQEQSEDQPLVAIGVSIAALTALSAFLKAAGDVSGRRTYAREIRRRERSHKR